MKPIIIYAQECDGKITLDKAAFEKAIQDAYEQGKADGDRMPFVYPNFKEIPGIDSTGVNPRDYGTFITCGSAEYHGIPLKTTLN